MLEFIIVEDPLTGLGILEIQSVMLWPGDEARQKDFMTGAYKVQQIYLETNALEVTQDPALQEGLAEWSRMIGGWQGIANSSPLSQLEVALGHQHAGGEVAGLVLALFYSWLHSPSAISDRPSKNKICYLLEDLGHQIIGRTIERKEVYSCWKRFGSVAHLWAAEYILRQFGDNRPDPSAYGFTPPKPYPADYSGESYVAMWKQLLVIAAKLLDFGIQYTPVGGNEPLLDLLNTHPILLPPEWDADIPEIGFPEAFRDSISAYKAPK